MNEVIGREDVQNLLQGIFERLHETLAGTPYQADFIEELEADIASELNALSFGIGGWQ